MAQLKELKQGEYFTKKAIEYPTGKQVWIRGEYCRENRKYLIYNWDDTNRFSWMDGNKEVFTEFTF